MSAYVDLLFPYVLSQTGGHFRGPEVYVVTWVGEGRIARPHAKATIHRNMYKRVEVLRVFLDPQRHNGPSVLPVLPSIAAAASPYRIN